ncbi:interleukin-1 receptor-associated kinase 3 isoform X5 [Myotis myotis]|uniref:interleukin-1 receptor-associated kinase 3 isoform X5 n=1 Tax=Myotis myotis TaxID=51298 RepID=UPI00174B89B3|nr:interleukin-1 receptor-associated kinase 3 isoform X5 [Myotis myotis]
MTRNQQRHGDPRAKPGVPGGIRGERHFASCRARPFQDLGSACSAVLAAAVEQDFRGCVTAPRGRAEVWAPHPFTSRPLVSGGRAMACAAAGSCGAGGALSVHTLLFDLPPALLGELCAILDSCDGALGWRGLAERLSNTWLDVRHIEKYVDQGKSGTRELLWSWAQKNKTVGDLLQILQEMGHHRAIHLIANHGAALNPPEQHHQGDGFPDLFSKETANVTVDNVPILEHNKKGIVLNSSISFQNIIEGTNNFHKGFLIGEGEIFEEKTMQCKKQWKRFLSELEVLLLANILLDDQFQPKLMDFAMAHFRPHLEPQSTTISMSSGSSNHLWYMPEEYIRQGKLSTKTDVYSFGIVIMEALTGCKVVLDDPKHIQLRDLLMELMEKRGLDSCVSFLDKKVFPCPRNFSAKLFSLAGQCAATRAKLRPSMDEVLTTLESTQVSLYFAEDPPTSLKSFRCPSPLFLDNVPSIPVEDDERQNRQPLLHDQHLRKERMVQKIPFECSQSEVTYLGLDGKTGNERKEDACKLPSSPPEERWSPKHAAPAWDSGAPRVDADPSAEAAGHAHRSRPVETSCSSEFVWNECEQNKKESILPEDKEDDKYYPGT